jgi:ribosomal protein S18 acetylase RimI-like enzyme
MKLNDASESDIDRLMSWFPDKRSVDIWGGPNFRYSLTPTTFQEDTHWREMDSCVLVGPSGDMLAFGQMYERHGRINLARLVVAPDQRGQGLGIRLVTLLMDRGREAFPLEEFSLYVYRDNHAAKACYTSAGFEEQEFPVGDDVPDNCIYMTRPV